MWTFYAPSVDPTMGTSLPASPVDGQEFTLVDSMSAPTYSWKFRYVSAKSSNKWVFVGGSGAYSAVETAESTTSTSYVALTTAGPSITVPVAGNYFVEHGFESNATASTENWMSYDVGATTATDANGVVKVVSGASYIGGASRVKQQDSLAAATAIVAKYRVTAGTSNFRKRWMRVIPIAVGG